MGQKERLLAPGGKSDGGGRVGFAGGGAYAPRLPASSVCHTN